MNKLLLLISFVLFLGLVSIDVYAATNYYVRTDGHDTNCNGLADAAAASAPACAYITIAKATTAATTAGDTVTVGDGTYQPASVLTFGSSGSAGLPITFQAKNKHLAIIDGTTVANTTQGFIKVTGNFVTLNGFKVINYAKAMDGGAPYQGKPVYVTGSDVMITNMYLDGIGSWAIFQSGERGNIINNYIKNPHSGMMLSGNNTITTGNEIDGMNPIPTSCGAYDMDYSRMEKKQYIANNYFHDCNGTAVTRCNYPVNKYHVDGIQFFDGTGSPNDVSGTIIENNYIGGYFNEGLEFSNNVYNISNGVTIRNNVFDAQTASWCMDIHDVKGVNIYNNTCYIPNSARGISVYVQGGGEHTVSGDISNNIIYGMSGVGGTYPFASDVAVTCSHNLYYRPAGAYEAQGSCTGDLKQIDPMFNDPTNRDFTLQSSSKAINAGVDLSSTGFSTDKNGVARPAGAWDIGAYEYVNTAPNSLKGGYK